MIGQVATVVEVFPDAADVLDLDQAFREIADLTGVPADVLNSKEEVQQIRDARAEQMRQMQEIEKTRAAGEAVGEVVGAAQGVSSLPPEVIQALQGSIPPREQR